MLKTLSFLLTFFILLFIFKQTTFAARSIFITADKSALFGDEEIVLTSSASGFTTGETIYVKGAFYQDGSTNYFGYTKNGNSWIKNGESTTSQKQIKIGEWDNKIILKSDFSDSGYKGEGSYKVKLGFYYLTSVGNTSSVNWSSNTIDLNISEPDPTPLPTSTSVPTAIPSSIKISPTITSKPTISVSPTISKQNTPTTKKQVLGAGASSGKTLSPTEIPVRDFTEKEKGNSIFGVLAMAAAAILLIACGILVYLKIRSRKQEV